MAVAQVVPALAGAATAKHHRLPLNATSSVKVGASSTLSSAATPWTTPADSYIHLPATSSSPSMYINTNACQLTGSCAPALDPDSSAVALS